MKNFNCKNIMAGILSVLIPSMLFMGCGSNSAGSSTTATSTVASTSKYDNSYCVNGQPSTTLQQLRKKGTLVVGSSGDAPFAYIDQKTGEFSGVDADIIKEVAKRLGIAKVEMKLMPFSQLILSENSHDIDIICDCMYIRKDRAQKVYFGDIWYTQGGGLLVPQNSKINGVNDFNPSSTVVGYTPGTVWQTVVEKWKSEGKIKEARATGHQTDSIVALQYGKIDAYITDSTVVENLFSNSPDTVKGLRIAKNYKDDASTLGRIAPSVSFDKIGFMKEVNKVVVKLRDEGFLKKVFEKYKLNPKLHMITNVQRTHNINTRSE
ncbi:MAG: ABC transporter substrate-binding protein [Oscillospiraceae bacterium]|nr:ABC transporter substrate-binding protein [Oscillospiraceae bacterium]